MAISTTEITSLTIASDNPIHQRQLYAYEEAAEYVRGDLLEIGCGVGRGVEVLINKCGSYTAIDRNQEVIKNLKQQFPELNFICSSVPPFSGAESDKYDCLVTCQVIEHIEDDMSFVNEIFRVLKPGGVAVVTTPNIKMSLTRNPWHVREYTTDELYLLVSKKFKDVSLLGIYGNDKVDAYYEMNKASVKKITRFDILNLQYRLPRTWLQIPYDVLNRVNRNRMQKQDNGLVTEITTKDFSMKPADDLCYDFFCVLRK